ncbi:MAG TPA: polysaccharide deacetylase family protein [Pyrinomonadaceae bacterium]|jgi:peptidoglycan/xylan/chitin deacetylase (PgdA/CDA1 family)|nr:polysaccharide deacetylase family protein [Pyrinomonadaceae bacterium]
MKNLVFTLLHKAGITRLSAWRFRKRVIFLCYHGVTERASRSASDSKGLHVNAKRFARHLAFLQKHYHIIPFREFLRAREENRRLPDNCAVLTFDDGFRNFLTVAAPMLAARKIPATVFLITGKAEESSNQDLPAQWSPLDDERYLSWDEARYLMNVQDIEFGSHTCSHPGLVMLSDADRRHELHHSHDELVSQLKVEIPTLSYPKGQYSDLVADDARNVGYSCAVTTDRGQNELNHDLFSLGRTLIGDFDDEAAFAVRVSGLRWSLVRALSTFRSSHRTAQPLKSAPATEHYSGEIFEIPN